MMALAHPCIYRPYPYPYPEPQVPQLLQREPARALLRLQLRHDDQVLLEALARVRARVRARLRVGVRVRVGVGVRVRVRVRVGVRVRVTPRAHCPRTRAARYTRSWPPR